ncbi:polysaccharide deacetylase family protein [Antarcticibacterium arcticum]|uniref:polysaccharide deacetylase family protein n=1 Tax=Antarcticibacterium arcticum TaxID=2585771 RepID=UPI00143CF9EA|nr:polysaccharide deacetylase family protein [Antarcticibacterium arcticum]
MLKVLVYHKIDNPVNFEKHLVYLQANYTLISINEILKFKDKNTNTQKPPLLITFDDGDLTIYNNAFPILKRYKIPAVIFVISGLIGTQEPFWWDEITYYNNTNGNSNAMIWEVKKWPNKKRINFIDQLKLNSSIQELKYPQLTYDHLYEMQAEGIDIANHSHTHPLFDRCTPIELKQEMTTSMEILKKENFLYDIFAYPNGNFSTKSEAVIKKAGIRMAFLFDHKININLDNPLRISRLIVDDTTPLWKFRFILSGYHSKVLPLRRKISKLLSGLRMV